MPRLYVVATPIGNLSDASPRMVETFEKVSLVVAEDTRVTGNLLRHFGISKPMTSLHRHNEDGKADGIVVRMLEEDIDAALATDAGTPAISDPGYVLVDRAARAGIEVLAIAGPAAMAAALSVSGFDIREFSFYGFLPRERGDLTKRLLEIARGTPIAVLHESPHRVTQLVETIVEVLPGCRVSVSCDLTKLHELTLRGEAAEVAAMLRENPKTDKGEYCLVLDMRAVQLPEAVAAVAASLEAQLFERMLDGESMQEAIAYVTGLGARKNDVKRAAIRVRNFLQSEPL